MSEEAPRQDGLPYSWDVTDSASDIKGDYQRYEGRRVSIAGRIVAARASGKLVFLDVIDDTDKMQCYADFSVLGEAKFAEVKRYNADDIIGAAGTVFKTNRGEVSVNAENITLLAKAMRTLPDKWHGLQDVELRYRKRYLDMIVNPDAKEVIRRRTIAIREIRRFLDGRGFMEVETPVIQPLYGGGDATPFKTYVNTLGEEDYLRIANELYLKRLIIGGMSRVYEVYKAFRNEDIDATHSPEFTMVEAYEAYADYEDMMRLAEGMLRRVCKRVRGSTTLEYAGNGIDLGKRFRRLRFVEAINEKLGLDATKLSDDELVGAAESHGAKFERGTRTRAHAYGKLLDMLIQPTLVQPTFITDWPKETSPLARPKRGDDRLVERFELYIGGLEVANAYSELNDAALQRENFEAQERLRDAGDKEAEPLDMDFVEAMEYGMPPTGGIGVGIDRLVMLLTNKQSIKEVIPFPMEKRLDQQDAK